MLRTINLTTMIVLVIGFCFATQWPAAVGQTSIAVTDGCGCDSNVCDSRGCDCKTCSSRRRLVRRCPKCQNDFCTLKCENVVVKKNCFDVDQKIVCIPRITWPWQKCCNRCAKTRTVNKLGVKKYECCECKYTWSVCEPPLPKTVKQLQDEEEKRLKELSSPAAAQPQFEQNELYDPAGSDVPVAPGG